MVRVSGWFLGLHTPSLDSTTPVFLPGDTNPEL